MMTETFIVVYFMLLKIKADFFLYAICTIFFMLCLSLG